MKRMSLIGRCLIVAGLVMLMCRTIALLGSVASVSGGSDSHQLRDFIIKNFDGLGFVVLCAGIMMWVWGEANKP